MFLLLHGSSHKVNDNIVVMLATSSSGERSFSRVKTYLMEQSRLNHLTLLKHKELLDNNYGLVSVAMNLFKLMTVEWRVIMIFY